MIRYQFAVAALAGLTLTVNAAKNYEEMDYGRFLSASWDNTKGQNTLKGKGCTANKGIAIQLGAKEGAMLFDTDLCRWAGGWTGGYVTYKGVIFDGGHGPNPGPAANASIYFETNPAPTWSKEGSFKEPRSLPKGPGAASVPFGPLPKDWVKYKGLYLSGDNVVVHYTVGTAELLEMPALETADGVQVLTRTTCVLAPGAASSEIVWEGEGASISAAGNSAEIQVGGDRIAIGGVGLPAGASFAAEDGKVVLKLPAFAAGQKFKIAFAKGSADSEGKLKGAVSGIKEAGDLRQYTKGGAAHWAESVKTPLTPGQAKDDAPYIVDTIGVPFKNPYNSWMRIGAFDFLDDGRIAVSTWSGDVWIVSGVNKDFQGEAVWKRYATGLFQALGLRVVKNQIYVLGRDQITRLEDLNNDGEADSYQCFNNDVNVSPGFHEFTFDLQTDRAGNFYFSKGGPVNPGGRGFQPFSDHAGCILRVSPDGSKLDVFATGVRAPNGISVGPNDEVTTGDNEGSWVPACYVHLVKPGDFITVADLSHRDPKPTDYGRHICFLPKRIDNSGGGQAWVKGNKWGLAEGSLLHLSYGTCSLFGVVYENASGVPQGGVYKFPLKFQSGTMRARFSPIDGQLYISGLRGWQTNAASDAMLQRVRYTGKPFTVPTGIHYKKNGIQLTFNAPLDGATAADAGNYALKVWNYKWSSDYGSAEYKPGDGSKGTEAIAIKGVKLSPDKKSVFIEVENLSPVMQAELTLKIKGADGTDVPDKFYGTINVIPTGA